MPKLIDYQAKKQLNICLTANSGSGKSVLSSYCPKPAAYLLFDKDTPTIAPGVDLAQVFYKTYPPAEVKLQDKDYFRPRNVMDGFISDVITIKAHFISLLQGKPTPLKLTMIDGSVEEWPTPATLVVEGASPIAAHAMNRLLTQHQKSSIEDFTTKAGSVNKFVAYDLRLQHLLDLYDIILRLPCTVVVTTWPKEDVKSEKVNGKVEITHTDIWRPDFGGKLNEQAPGKFDTSLYLFTDNGRYFARTRSNNKYIGFKVGNQFLLPEKLDLTIEKDKAGNLVNPCEALWNLLLKKD